MSDTSPYEVKCPVCAVEAGRRCRTLKTGRTTDTHVSRIALHYEAITLSHRLDMETRCGRCGVGMKSGENYPSCTTDRSNCERFCRNWSDDLCSACEREVAKEYGSEDPR